MKVELKLINERSNEFVHSYDIRIITKEKYTTPGRVMINKENTDVRIAVSDSISLYLLNIITSEIKKEVDKIILMRESKKLENVKKILINKIQALTTNDILNIDNISHNTFEKYEDFNNINTIQLSKSTKFNIMIHTKSFE